ncbi:BLUF domain-containing protein [Salinibius halmophilus]|uniref:BLUF domain-containing protein n=1 Tax=Salinibius halmophilus TaxID=1853216 RepID=UPI000E66E7A6|nr:BLUF domain-containing protein [Salinibius halmophilus]
MTLVRLVYASRATDQMQTHDIVAILEAAKRNNGKLGVTGMLIFNSAYFLQCLEGPRMAVNHIYQNIAADKRHAQPVLLDYREISERRFHQWTMGYIGEDKFLAEHLLRYSGTDQFNPFEMSGESAHSLLLAAAEELPTI